MELLLYFYRGMSKSAMMWKQQFITWYYIGWISTIGSFFWIWLSLIFYGYNSFTILAVCILAVMTRNIKHECFKDTKKVNAFVFVSILALIICFGFATAFAATNVEEIELAYTFDCLPFVLIAVFCKVFLFLPKVWSARVEKPRYRHCVHTHVQPCTSHTP